MCYKKFSEKKLYFCLRRKIYNLGYTNLTLFAPEVNISKSEFAAKLNGKFAFTQDEMYDILDFLGIDYSCMSTYFPKRSMEQRTIKKRKTT